MAAFDVLNPIKLPKLPAIELTALVQYGNSDVESLVKLFDGVQECLEEWASFRQYLNDNFRQFKHSEIVNDLRSPPSLAASVYPRISKLGKIC